jgi:transcriptional regulator with XRE-family HTH domain
MACYLFIVPKPRKLSPPAELSQLTELPSRLAALRKAHGFTQAQLADLIGVSRDLMSNFEKGRTRLTDESIINLARALKVSTDELLGLTPTSVQDEAPGLRFTRRLRDLDQLPEAKKKAILKTLDDLIRANS